MENKMNKPWCVYGDLTGSFTGYMHIGKIVKYEENSTYILYCEGQKHPPVLWDNNYVKRFDTIEKTIDFCATWVSVWERKSKKMIKRRLCEIVNRDFPSEKIFEEVRLEN